MRNRLARPRATYSDGAAVMKNKPERRTGMIDRHGAKSIEGRKLLEDENYITAD